MSHVKQLLDSRESEILTNPANESKTGLPVKVIFFDPAKDGLQERFLNLSGHQDRMKLNKTVIWAVNNKIELRIISL